MYLSNLYKPTFMCVCVLQEASRYHNQTSMQLQMLDFSRQHLVNDDEVRNAARSPKICIQYMNLCCLSSNSYLYLFALTLSEKRG